jgi:hypothetical protein
MKLMNLIHQILFTHSHPNGSTLIKTLSTQTHTRNVNIPHILEINHWNSYSFKIPFIDELLSTLSFSSKHTHSFAGKLSKLFSLIFFTPLNFKTLKPRKLRRSEVIFSDVVKVEFSQGRKRDISWKQKLKWRKEEKKRNKVKWLEEQWNSNVWLYIDSMSWWNNVIWGELLRFHYIIIHKA